MMTLFTKVGTPKLVADCTYPLTGVGCVDRVYTDVATFTVGTVSMRVLETFGTPYDGLAAMLDVLPAARAKATSVCASVCRRAQPDRQQSQSQGTSRDGQSV